MIKDTQLNVFKTGNSSRNLFILLCALAPCTSFAIIQYSATQNIAIPLTFEGIYLDIDTGTTSTSEFADWDINFFYGGTGIANNTDFQPAKTSNSWDAPIRNLDLGIKVDSGTDFYSSGLGGSSTHLGSGTDQFTIGLQGYIGVEFTPNGSSGTSYAWLRVTLMNNQSGGVIHDWAWEDSGGDIEVGAVPEPELFALSLAALCCFIFVLKRR